MAVLALPAALALLDTVSGHATPEDARLEDYGTVPAFELTERSGRRVARDDLVGRPWLASFVFTRCPDFCPTVSGRIAELDRRLPEGVPLISLSVDPEHDTPAVLQGYAERLDASDRWLFLTGGFEEIRSLVAEGFHLSIAQDGHGAITHSDRVALVDGSLRIRAYYRGTEPGWVEEALRDLDALGVR